MAGLFAKGTGLYVGDGASPEVFTKIANVKPITGPGYNVTIVDTTTHSTVGNFREKAAVLVDAGKLGFRVNYDPADPTLAPATGLLNALQNLTEKNYQLRFPPSDTGKNRMNFKGFVSQHSFTFPVDNVIEADVAFEIDGAITFDTFV